MTDAPRDPSSGAPADPPVPIETGPPPPPPPTAQPAHDQPHSVLCERHGLRYNPRTHAGCARCRGVAASANPAIKSPASGPPLVFWILLGSAMVAGAVLLFSGGQPEEGAAVATPGSAPDAGSPPAESPGSPTSEGAGADPAVASTTDWPTHDAIGEVFIEDQPESEPFMIDDKAAPDLRSVRFRGYNGHLLVTFEFTRGLDDHARDMAVGLVPAVAFLDSDLNESTGEKGFAGRTGFEKAIVGYVGVRYDPDAESYLWTGGQADTPIFDHVCSHDVGTVSGYFLDLSFDPGDPEALENTTCSGTTLTARVPYERLGVVAGQQVRIATEENMGGGNVRQYFLDDALITLQ